MSSRSPARFLAPLALIAAVLAVYLVSRSELEDEPAGSTSSAATSTSSSGKAKGKGTTSTTSARTSSGKKPKTYTVKPGDVLGSISEETGVAVADLLDYNDIDAQSLSVGQKLKLTP